ncbi:hypothetical protein EVAR_65475_1 [Eumeta japonica]|uniref:Uncharacterized protein n=1 Tax=Eumeta variegata TaxID=151549 RepID=A0A4C2A3U6_EUMVA|nr:hypothetical protein EVAR_65475_1 [Eumeta japonica]
MEKPVQVISIIHVDRKPTTPERIRIFAENGSGDNSRFNLQKLIIVERDRDRVWKKSFDVENEEDHRVRTRADPRAHWSSD